MSCLENNGILTLNGTEEIWPYNMKPNINNLSTLNIGTKIICSLKKSTFPYSEATLNDFLVGGRLNSTYVKEYLKQ